MKKVWLEYSETVTSPSVKSVLRNAETTIVNEDNILITVGSTMAKGMIQQEYSLMNFIRKGLNHNKLIMEVKIDPSKITVEDKPKPKKLTTPKDKYDKMMEINPLVDELRKRFDLKIDKDS